MGYITKPNHSCRFNPQDPMGFWVPSPFQFADTWRIAQNAAPLASDIVEAICWCEIRKLSHLGPGRTGTGDKLMDTFYILMARLCWRVFADLLYDLTHLYVDVMSLLCPCTCTVHSMPRDLWNKVPWEQGRTGHQGFKMETPLLLLEKWLFGGAVVCQTRTASDLWRFKRPEWFPVFPGFRLSLSPFFLGTICRPSLHLNLIMMKMMMTTTGHWKYGTMEPWRMRCQLMILVLMNWNNMNERFFWNTERLWLQKCFLRL